jgi:hypothetical protein
MTYKVGTKLKFYKVDFVQYSTRTARTKLIARKEQ